MGVSFLYVMSIRSENYSAIWDNQRVPPNVMIAPPSRVKIGHCKKLNSRKSSIANYVGVSSTAIRIDVQLEFPTKAEARAAERSLHARYAQKALGHEWFNLDQSDIDAITALLGCSVGKAHALAKE
jgi:hypothetical protein